MNKIRIGTRGSRLALAQSNHVAATLRAAHPHLDVEILIIQTQGDRVLDAPLSRIGGKGVFTKEIEQALLDGRIDLAVHSLKDLPTNNPPGLIVGAIPKRESPRDVMVTPRPRVLESFGAGDVIGTSSLRRAAQLRARFPHVEVRELRGNVPTRVRKLTDEGYSAIVLAEAGLRRLGLQPPAMQPLEDDVMLPAPGQGALGLQIRADDLTMMVLLAPLNDAETAACCIAERALLDRLGGGCQVPLGAHASVLENGQLRLRGRVIALDGKTVIDCEVVGSPAQAFELGERAAAELRAQGAARVIEAALQPQHENAPEPESSVDEPRVIVTRDEDADGPLSRELRAHGLVPVCLPLMRTRVNVDLSELEVACERGVEWLVLSSANAVEALHSASTSVHRAVRLARVACVGEATAAALERALGVKAHVTGLKGRDDLLERLIPLVKADPGRVLVAQGNLAPATVADTLRATGCPVEVAIVYEIEAVEESGVLLRELLERGACEAISFCSTSAVETFVRLVPNAGQILRSQGIRVASIGESTSLALHAAHLPVDVEAETPSFVRLSECLHRLLSS